jgi:hypothetical protein
LLRKACFLISSGQFVSLVLIIVMSERRAFGCWGGYRCLVKCMLASINEDVIFRVDNSVSDEVEL